MKILATKWFTATSLIGVVCIENGPGERSVRMSAVTVKNYTTEEDAKFCADYGAKLSFDEAKGFFPELITKKNFKNY